mmetsp:Transcript_35383/g.40968  ORF Transcript_35383/g.40968 Transcript_35383/m.40968 type:complete len:227 (-) Transcript_35383:3200-3880(-)
MQSLPLVGSASQRLSLATMAGTFIMPLWMKRSLRMRLEAFFWACSGVRFGFEELEPFELSLLSRLRVRSWDRWSPLALSYSSSESTSDSRASFSLGLALANGFMIMGSESSLLSSLSSLALPLALVLVVRFLIRVAPFGDSTMVSSAPCTPSFLFFSLFASRFFRFSRFSLSKFFFLTSRFFRRSCRCSSETSSRATFNLSRVRFRRVFFAAHAWFRCFRTASTRS